MCRSSTTTWRTAGRPSGWCSSTRRGRIIEKGVGIGTIFNHEDDPQAELGALSVEGAPGAGGPFAKLDIGTFAAGTTAYAVTVPHGTTHARLTATVGGAGLTLRSGAGSSLTAVLSGAAGPAVALAVGDTVLTAQATAPSGGEQDLHGDGDAAGAAAVVGRRPRRAVGGGRRGRQLDGAGHRRLCGGDDGLLGHGAARDDAGAADGDGGRRRRDADAARHRVAPGGRQRPRGEGDRRGRYDQDLHGDGDARGAGAVVERRPVRAVGRGRHGRQLDGAGHRRLCGGYDGVRGDGAARDDAGAPDGDGGRRRGGADAARHRVAPGGRQRPRGEGDRRGWHEQDLPGDDHPAGGARRAGPGGGGTRRDADGDRDRRAASGGREPDAARRGSPG